MLKIVLFNQTTGETMIVTCVEILVLCLMPGLGLELPSQPPLSSYPAVMVFYDPALGGINCDDDCSTVASGPFTTDMYKTAGACHPDLLSLTVYFPAIDLTMHCVDTGSLVTVAWNNYYQRTIIYFDVLWPAAEPPPWLYWLIYDWRIIR